VRSLKPVFITLIGVLFIGLSIVSGQIDVTVQSDTNHIRIGEQIGVKLIVINHSKESPEITWPFAVDTLSKAIEIIDVLPVDTQRYEEETIFMQQWYLTSFDTGYHDIPPFELVINGEDYETNPFLIQVETVKIDTTQAIKVIKGVENAPISIFEWIKYHWKWFAGLSVLLILLFGIYLIIKNKNKGLKTPVKRAEPEIPPFDYALQRLNKLKDEKKWQGGDVKYYHSEISEILREYLEHEFDFPALEQTTKEVMRSIRLTSIDATQQKHLSRILLLSDLVKYAKEKPLATENEDSMKVALEFLTTTKPVVEKEIIVKEEGDEA
jgi:hypothetical protein